VGATPQALAAGRLAREGVPLPRAAARHNAAMRTVVEVPDDQLAALDAWCEAHGVSRAEALRQAIARLLCAEGTRCPISMVVASA
jgi:hypothetical protein